MTYPCCGKSTGHATWCTSTPRMLAGEAVTYTNARTVVKHETTIDTDWTEHLADPAATPVRYRWRCSCGASPGRWVTRRFQAEQGAKTHARRAR